MNRIIIVAVFIVIFLQACKISYSFSGANTGNLETVSVQYFVDRSNLAPPNLPQVVTDELRDMIMRQTSLTMINGLAEANFEGEIRTYDGMRPVAISGDDVASLNRFTISVKVKYSNSLDPDLNFEETFSQYQDYDSKRSFQDVESELTEEIVKQIIEDIFNRAFVNW
jgi:hypothetical protein